MFDRAKPFTKHTLTTPVINGADPEHGLTLTIDGRRYKPSVQLTVLSCPHCHAVLWTTEDMNPHLDWHAKLGA
jgi:hypothetical protein